MPAYSNQDIVDYARAMGYLNAEGVIKDDTTAKALYTDAQRYGVSANQLDQAFGMQPGLSQRWITGNGLGNLTGSVGAPAPPPTPYNAKPYNRSYSPFRSSGGGGSLLGSSIDAGGISSMINDIMSGMGGDVPGAPNKPGSFTMTQEMLDGIDTGKRINSLLDSPTARRAEDLAMIRGNRRGLLNSSMTAEAANQAMIAEAGNIASGDADRYLSLLSTGLNNDASMDRLFAQAGFDERNLQLRDRNDTRRGLLEFSLNDAADIRDSNLEYQRDRERTSDEREYDDYWRGIDREREDYWADRNERNTDRRRTEDWGRDDRMRSEDWARDDLLRTEDWSREDNLAGQAVRGAYSQQLLGLRDGLNEEISAIENSDLPPEVKAARVAEIRGRYQTLMQLTNDIFTALPQWQDEWTQLTLEG